jgi:osmotically-inducible protein OsmY
MNTPDLNSTSILRPDDDVLADIWEGIWQVAVIRSTDMHSLSITVQDGVAVLDGHMSGTFNRLRVENIARSVPGVVAVCNRVVVDGELEMGIAQALAHDARTSPYLLPVGSDHGWVRVGGTVDSREVQAAAEAVAARVPSVRGVIGLPRIAGEPPAPRRRAVQPHVGAQVYAENGRAGVVAQVVINPQSRLVTHMVVSASDMVDTYDDIGFRPMAGTYLVPIEAAKVVNDQSVILAPQPPSLTSYPLFDALAYPPAPGVAAWRAPYPYTLTPGVVRWFRPKAAEAAHVAAPQPAIAWPTAASPTELSSTLWSKAKERQAAAPQHA